MSDYFVYYMESNIVCVIIFGIMLSHDLLNVDRQEKQIKYDHALIAFMLYFISDALWSGIIDGVFPRNKFTILAINFSNYIIMTGITFMWLRFVMAYEQAPHRDRKINKFAVMFPLLVSAVALVVIYIRDPELILKNEFELQPVYNLFLVIVPCIYIAAVIIYVLRRARNEENPMEKRKHLYVGFFPLIVVGGGILQVVVMPTTSVFCFCCTILMLLFYIQSMESRISLDPLTNLNNRGQLLRYISQKANVHMEGLHTFVIMIDVNDFKMINDTYGHAEGDHALVIIAESLKRITARHSTPMFLGRYGGDEFIVIARLPDEKSIEPLIADIRAQIEKRCTEVKAPYMISIGAGYDRLPEGEDTFQKCMERADNNLYLDKEFQKAHGRSTICRE